MAMQAQAILDLIHAAFPGAEVTLTDLAGDGDHYELAIAAAEFRGKPRVAQHQMVYAALQGKMGGELHALALKTRER